MDTTQNVQNKDVVVQWPEPAHLRLQQDQSAEAACSIEFANGERLAGMLTYFTGRDSYLIVKSNPPGSDKSGPFLVALSAIKQIQLTDLVDARAYDDDPGEQAYLTSRTGAKSGGLQRAQTQVYSVTGSRRLWRRRRGDVQPAETQVYSVEFNDGEILSGETAGCVSMPNGIFLYSQASEDMLRRVFIPKSAVASFHMGDPMGRLLLQEHAVSEDDLKHAVEKQEEMRRHLLGEYLLSEAYVTQKQLNQAMELQKAKPNLRLGEALIELGAFTADALEAALAHQRSDRSRPLGQILIEMGVLDQQTLQKIHDKKSGRPSVSLANFSIASDIRRKIPEATARYFGVVPLATEDDALIVACSVTPDATTQGELNRLAGMRVVAVIATPDEIRVKQNELYSSRTVDSADRNSSGAAKRHAVDSRSSDSSVARLFENGDPIDLVEHAEPVSERALLIVAQCMLGAARQGGVLDIHVETEAGKRRTNISFRRVPDSSAV